VCATSSIAALAGVCAARSASDPARHLAVDWNVPIGCCGVLVMPGDPEGRGVVCIRAAEEVARTGSDLDDLEAFVLEKIKAGAPVPGTYPPDEKTRAEYEAWRKARG
jgi:regulator of RNase E activity RraA